MQWFESKRALLEYLGKNTEDRKLVDRMMARGTVVYSEGMYYLMEEEDKEKLLNKITEPREVKVYAEDKSAELEEAKIQWEYYKQRCEKYKRAINLVIHETYVVAKAKLGNKMEEEAEFREAILGAVRGQLWE